MPLVLSALKGKPNFSTSVRLLRILYTLLRRHLTLLPKECGMALDILTQLLDQDTAIWKRALCMEVFRGIFSEHGLIRRIYALFDAKEGEKDIFKTLSATFVRLSTEKPAVIGLGHQSSMPIADQGNNGGSSDQAMLEAGGMTGIISGSVASESSINIGISVKWSSIRAPCIDQLDKTDPPFIPESYIYSLILACISSLSDGLAKFVLPLTVPGDAKPRRKVSRHEAESPKSTHLEAGGASPKSRLERSASFKKNPVPLNPLELEDHPLHKEIMICSSIVDECWPAILATCSTFLFAALDSEYYHGLVRAFQRFAHVAGLLQLATPRDAFLTTLGKSAVPPNVLTACLNNQGRPQTPGNTQEGQSSVLSNAKGLLSVEGLTPASPSNEKQRQPSFDVSAATLNTRNLLCLRALLNLGIALGPTLSSSWSIILETLQQADLVLFSTGKTPGRTPSIGRGQDPGNDSEANALMANFGNEVRSVETAAARLIESTIDFPNEPFVEVVEAMCNLLEATATSKPSMSGSQTPTKSDESPALSPRGHRRVFSFSSQAAAGSNQESLFALAKLGEMATTNIERMMSYPPEATGWGTLLHQLIKTLDAPSMTAPVRIKAAETIAQLMFDSAREASSLESKERGPIQLRLLGALRDAILPLQIHGRGLSVASHATDADIHRIILEGLRGILETCGESLVDGWDIAFDIIVSVFISSDSVAEEPRASTLATRSTKLVRSSFGSLQLICSDFLASLPHSCFLILVDTLYKFSSQDDDLNIALTTVTFFWALSDFLSTKAKSLEITAQLMEDAQSSDLSRIAADESNKSSSGALWMMLLLRLTSVSADERLELRNSAIQTLLRIFDAYGDRLSPEAWSTCIESVVFKLLASIREVLSNNNKNEVESGEREEWNGTAVVVLDGISTLLANYIDVLTSHSAFDQLWRELLGHLAALLDFHVLSINTATFKSLRHVLSQTGEGDKPSLSPKTVEFAWDLWSRGIPTSKVTSKKDDDNQECLIAYVSALQEVYRLVQPNLTVDRVERILELLGQTIQEATAGGYVTDVENVTRLQSQVLSAVEMIRMDIKGVPSVMITNISRFAIFAYDVDHSTKPSPRKTFVALSKASVKLLQKFILEHGKDKDIFASSAFTSALNAINAPISLKYEFPVVTKSDQPWRVATTSALTILDFTLPKLNEFDLPKDNLQSIWAVVVKISNGILSADCDAAPSNTNIASDEEFDIQSFKSLRDLIIPALGQAKIAEKTRKIFAENLFRTSIIHEPTSTDHEIINGGNEAGLSALYEPRSGRTLSVPAARRTKIAYVAFEELFSLVSLGDTTVEKTKSTTKSAAGSESNATLRNKLAATVAPLVILRCALTLRAYVADQPLRGKMPQPLSQKKELVWTLERLVDLKSINEAIPDLQGAKSESRKHLLRLYPLLVRGLAVGGDEKVQRLLRNGLEVIGGELGIL